MLVIRDESDGHMGYHAFTDAYEYAEWRDLQPKPWIHHEIVREQQPRKFMIDLDLKTEISRASAIAIADLLRQVIATTLAGLLPDNWFSFGRLPKADEDVYVYLSDLDRVRGMHVVLNRFVFKTGADATRMAAEVRKILEKVRPELVEAIDTAPYRAGFSMRMPLSDKMDRQSRRASGRPKVLVPTEAQQSDDPLYGLLTRSGDLSDPEAQLIVLVESEPKYTNPEYNVKATPEVARALELVGAHAVGRHFCLRNYQTEEGGATLLNFDRRVSGESIYCPCCKRTHEEDNFLFAVLTVSGNLTMYCRRAPQHNNMIDAPIRVHREAACKPKSASTPIAARDAGPNFAELMFSGNIVTPKMERHDPLAGIPVFGSQRTLLVRAPMGAGKTERLVARIRELPSTAKILFVSFRKTFSQSMQQRLQTAGIVFEMYSQIAGKLCLSKSPRLIVQVESLRRMSQEAADLLVLDESESIMAQFCSGNVKELPLAFANFMVQVQGARQLIALDAELSSRTTRSLAAMGRPGGELLWCDYAYETGWQVYMHRTQASWLHELNAQLGARAGETQRRVVVVSNSKATIDKLELWLRETRPDLNVLAYTSETNAAQRAADFADIDRRVENVQVLLYSPTLLAGVSINLDSFDVGFSWFTPESCDVGACRQMEKRIRRLTSRTRHVFVSGTDGYWPDTREALARFLDADIYQVAEYNPTDGLRLAVHDGRIYADRSDPFYTLWIETTLVKNQSHNSFEDIYRARVLASGASIFEKEQGDARMELLLAEKVNRQLQDREAKTAQRIASANLECLNCLGDEELSEEERDARQLKAIMNTYQRDQPPSAYFVLNFGSWEVMQQYKNRKEYEDRDFADLLVQIGNATRAAVNEGGGQQLLKLRTNSEVRKNEQIKYVLHILKELGFKKLANETVEMPDSETLLGLQATVQHACMAADSRVPSGRGTPDKRADELLRAIGRLVRIAFGAELKRPGKTSGLLELRMPEEPTGY